MESTRTEVVGYVELKVIFHSYGGHTSMNTNYTRLATHNGQGNVNQEMLALFPNGFGQDWANDMVQVSVYD